MQSVEKRYLLLSLSGLDLRRQPTLAMITPAEINDQMRDNAMTKEAAQFEAVMQQIRDSFYDLPAPGSEHLKWAHVGSAQYVVDKLRHIANFLKS